MIQSNSPVYHQVLQNIRYFITSGTGTIGTLADRQSQTVLMSHVTRQSFVQAIDDDFLLAAIITMVCAIPVIFLKIGKKGKGKNRENVLVQNPDTGIEEQQQNIKMTAQA